MRISTFAACFLSAAFAVSAAPADNTPLLLTPLIEAGKFQEARQLSKVNYEGKDLGYSAFISVKSASGMNTNNMFFWIIPCTGGCDQTTSPFNMWMQGGPGGPSTFGNLAEIGPFYVDQDKNLQERCYSWCKDRSCLFIDQPVQTGFSYQVNSTGHFDPKNIEYTKNSIDATVQMYEVIQQLFKVFPEYVKSPFVVTGESYGGLYTANMMWTIAQKNAALKPGDALINLWGVSVGDPIINHHYQWKTYGNTLYGMGVIMLDEREIIDNIMTNGSMYLDSNCTKAFEYWNSVWNDDGGGGYPGLYYQFTGSSMTENVLLGAEPAGFGWSVDFLKIPAVQVAMHVAGIPGESFAEGGEVYHTMVNSGDFCANSSWIYASLFMEGYDVTIYTGTVDPLLGAPTSEAGVVAIFDYAEQHLAGGADIKKAFFSAKKAVWRVNATDIEPTGYARCVTHPTHKNNFCYVSIRNAGHESPAFQPRANYDNFLRFLERRPYNSTGNRPVPEGPTCGCSGVPPFAGPALPKCAAKEL
eukprot:TRINITY_DN37122_c0_g1_i1.p1 TRINITY_DN37122_c0_g1~~TRINITY_DN37122_c0_g1_i1.p1  ORF type:complete len:541 (+),score=132.41 TRINITY_DN37122_c0_g1_i1:43-1623(+)